VALNRMGAGFVLKAYDQSTPVLRRIGSGFRGLRKTVKTATMGMSNSMANTAMGFAAFHAGLGMVKLSKVAADSASKFQQSLAAVGKVARATEKELVLLHDAAIEAALGTKFSPDEAIEGLQTLSAMGLKAKESIQALNPVLELATGSLGQLGVAGAADAVIGTVKAMGFEIDQAARVTNQLLKITQMTNFQSRDFAASMGRVASTAKLYNQSLEDSLITMGLMRNMNIDASVASTSLRESWRRLATDQRAQQAVEKQGIKIFRDKDGKIRDMLGVMTQLADKTKDLRDKEKMRLITVAFGVRGMAAFNAVANATYTVMKNGEKINLSGSNAINAMRYELSVAGETLTDVQKESLKAALGVKALSDVLKTSVGVSREFRDALLETYEGQKQLVSGAWKTLLVVIGEDFAKAMKPAAHALYELVSAVTLFIKSMSPQAKATVFKFVVVLGGLLMLGGGLLLLSGAMNMLGGSLLGFVFSIGKLLVIGAPLLMILSGLGIGFTSLFKAMNLFKGEGMDVARVMEVVRLGASGMMSILTGEKFSKDLKDNLSKAENQGLVKFLQKFSRWMVRIKTFWRGLTVGFEQGIAILSKSSAFNKFKEKLEGIIAVFTGPDAENSDKILKEWAQRGAEAGRKLARLGETAADVVGKIVELGGAFSKFMANVTAEDMQKGIDTMVEGFRTFATVLSTVKTFFGQIYHVVKLLLVGIYELFDMIVRVSTMGIETVWSKLFGSEKEQRAVASYWDKEFAQNPLFGNTKSTASDLANLYNAAAEQQAESEARDAEFARANAGYKALNGLRTRKEAVQEGIKVPTAAVNGPGAESLQGNNLFGGAQNEMQQQFLKELAGINHKLTKMADNPQPVYIDGEKLGEINGRQPSVTGEDSLDEAPVSGGF